MKDFVKQGKKRRILLLTVGAVVLAFLCVGIFSVREILLISEKDQTKVTYVPVPEFSVGSGFYENPFELQLSAGEGAKIYYTTDGSDPTEKSMLYSSPICIEDATKNPNVYSARTDVSAGFYSDLIREYKTLDADPHYKAPDYLVDKCTVIRAIAVLPDGDQSNIVTSTYFVGKDAAEYDGCNIISVVTDPKNLFDKKTGIYVTGDIFTNYMKGFDVGEHWRFWEANYRARGKEWERPASITFFQADGALIGTREGFIRTQGGISRGALPRSLNLFSDSDASGDLSLFPEGLFRNMNGYAPGALTLAAGGNQTITNFNDFMMTEKVRNRNYATMEYEPYVLFLDGEYWGFYWLATRYDARYFNYRYGVNEDDVFVIKNDEVSIGSDFLKSQYNSMRSFIAHSNMTSDANYLRASELIDMDSFIDYYATQIYIARKEDWPISNYALWRSEKEDSQNIYADGKWRWMLFDSNSPSMSASLITHDTLGEVLGKDQLFASLWKNEEFKNAFRTRIFEIADTCFDPDEMSAMIDAYADKMFSPLSKSWKRFYGKDNEKEMVFREKMESYREFFKGRKAVVESWF